MTASSMSTYNPAAYAIRHGIYGLFMLNVYNRCKCTLKYITQSKVRTNRRYTNGDDKLVAFVYRILYSPDLQVLH